MSVMLSPPGCARMVAASSTSTVLGWRRRRLLCVALAATALVSIGIAPPAAHATASGCTASGFGLPKFGLSSAYTCVYVYGSGLNVSSSRAEWSGGGAIANYQFMIRWYDRYNRLYWTSVGPYNSGTRYGGAWATFGPGRALAGRACAELYQSGSRRSGVPCVSIYP